MNGFKNTLRIVALCTVAMFSVTTVAWSAPDGGASIVRRSAMSQYTQTTTQQNPFGAYSVSIPAAYGTVRARYKGKDDFTVVLLKDAHIVYEAQQNIAQIVKKLATDYTNAHPQKNVADMIIGVEGARGPINVLPYRDFSDVAANDAVLKYFMRQGLLTGVEYCASTYPDMLTVCGVEDMDLYNQNYAAFVNATEKRALLKVQLGLVGDALNKLKKRLFSKQLQRLDDSILAYRNGKSAAVEHDSLLAELVKSAQVDVSEYPNFSLFYNEVFMRESEFSTDAVNAEVLMLVNHLLAQMGAGSNDYETVTRLTEKLNAGEVKESDYYQFLKRFVQKYGVSMLSYTNVYNYTHYLDAYARVDTFALQFERKAVEDLLVKTLATDADMRELFALSDNLWYVNAAVDMKVFREEKRTLEDRAAQFKVLDYVHFITRQSARFGLPVLINFDIAYLNQMMPEVCNFYNVSFARDDALIENFLALYGVREGMGVLLTGGYHTEGITKYLQQKDISYVVVSPVITQVQEGVEEIYFQRMLGRLDPLSTALVDAKARVGQTLLTQLVPILATSLQATEGKEASLPVAQLRKIVTLYSLVTAKFAVQREGETNIDQLARLLNEEGVGVEIASVNGETKIHFIFDDVINDAPQVERALKDMLGDAVDVRVEAETVENAEVDQSAGVQEPEISEAQRVRTTFTVKETRDAELEQQESSVGGFFNQVVVAAQKGDYAHFSELMRGYVDYANTLTDSAELMDELRYIVGYIASQGGELFDAVIFSMVSVVLSNEALERADSKTFNALILDLERQMDGIRAAGMEGDEVAQRSLEDIYEKIEKLKTRVAFNAQQNKTVETGQTTEVADDDGLTEAEAQQAESEKQKRLESIMEGKVPEKFGFDMEFDDFFNVLFDSTNKDLGLGSTEVEAEKNVRGLQENIINSNIVTEKIFEKVNDAVYRVFGTANLEALGQEKKNAMILELHRLRYRDNIDAVKKAKLDAQIKAYESEIEEMRKKKVDEERIKELEMKMTQIKERKDYIALGERTQKLSAIYQAINTKLLEKDGFLDSRIKQKSFGHLSAEEYKDIVEVVLDQFDEFDAEIKKQILELLTDSAAAEKIESSVKPEELMRELDEGVIRAKFESMNKRDSMDNKFATLRNEKIDGITEMALKEVLDGGSEHAISSSLRSDVELLVKRARQQYEKGAYGRIDGVNVLMDAIDREIGLLKEGGEIDLAAKIQEELFGNKKEMKQGKLVRVLEGKRHDDFKMFDRLSKRADETDLGLLHNELQAAREEVKENSGHEEESIIAALAVSALGLRLGNGYFHFPVQSAAAVLSGFGFNLQAETGFGKTETIAACAAMYYVLDVGNMTVFVPDDYFITRDHEKRVKVFDAMGISSIDDGEDSRGFVTEKSFEGVTSADPESVMKALQDNFYIDSNGNVLKKFKDLQSFELLETEVEFSKQELSRIYSVLFQAGKDQEKRAHLDYDILTTSGQKTGFRLLSQSQEMKAEDRWLTERAKRGVVFIDEGDDGLNDRAQTKMINSNGAGELKKSEFAVHQLAHRVAKMMIGEKYGAELGAKVIDEGEKGSFTLNEGDKPLIGFTYDTAKMQISVQDITEEGKVIIKKCRSDALQVAKENGNEALQKYLEKEEDSFEDMIANALLSNALYKAGEAFDVNHISGDVKLINFRGDKLFLGGQRSQGNLGVQLDFVARDYQDEMIKTFEQQKSDKILKDLLDAGVLTEELLKKYGDKIDEKIDDADLRQLSEINQSQIQDADERKNDALGGRFTLDWDENGERIMVLTNADAKPWTLRELIASHIIVKQLVIKGDSLTSNQIDIHSALRKTHERIVQVSGTLENDILDAENEKIYGASYKGYKRCPAGNETKKNIGKTLVSLFEGKGENGKFGVYESRKNELLRKLDEGSGFALQFDLIDIVDMEDFKQWLLDQQDVREAMSRHNYEIKLYYDKLGYKEKAHLLEEEAGFRTIMLTNIYQRGAEIDFKHGGGFSTMILGKIENHIKSFGSVEGLDLSDWSFGLTKQEKQELFDIIDSLTNTEEWVSDEKRIEQLEVLFSFLSKKKKQLLSNIDKQSLSEEEKRLMSLIDMLDVGEKTLFFKLFSEDVSLDNLSDIEKTTLERLAGKMPSLAGSSIERAEDESAFEYVQRAMTQVKKMDSQKAILLSKTLFDFQEMSEMFVARMGVGHDYEVRFVNGERLTIQKFGRVSRQVDAGSTNVRLVLGEGSQDQNTWRQGLVSVEKGGKITPGMLKRLGDGYTVDSCHELYDEVRRLAKMCSKLIRDIDVSTRPLREQIADIQRKIDDQNKERVEFASAGKSTVEVEMKIVDLKAKIALIQDQILAWEGVIQPYVSRIYEIHQIASRNIDKALSEERIENAKKDKTSQEALDKNIEFCRNVKAEISGQRQFTPDEKKLLQTKEELFTQLQALYEIDADGNVGNLKNKKMSSSAKKAAKILREQYEDVSGKIRDFSTIDFDVLYRNLIERLYQETVVKAKTQDKRDEALFEFGKRLQQLFRYESTEGERTEVFKFELPNFATIDAVKQMEITEDRDESLKLEILAAIKRSHEMCSNILYFRANKFIEEKVNLAIKFDQRIRGKYTLNGRMGSARKSMFFAALKGLVKKKASLKCWKGLLGKKVRGDISWEQYSLDAQYEAELIQIKSEHFENIEDKLATFCVNDVADEVSGKFEAVGEEEMFTEDVVRSFFSGGVKAAQDAMKTKMKKETEKRKTLWYRTRGTIARATGVDKLKGWNRRGVKTIQRYMHSDQDKEKAQERGSDVAFQTSETQRVARLYDREKSASEEKVRDSLREIKHEQEAQYLFGIEHVVDKEEQEKHAISGAEYLKKVNSTNYETMAVDGVISLKGEELMLVEVLRDSDVYAKNGRVVICSGQAGEHVTVDNLGTEDIPSDVLEIVFVAETDEQGNATRTTRVQLSNSDVENVLNAYSDIRRRASSMTGEECKKELDKVLSMSGLLPRRFADLQTKNSAKGELFMSQGRYFLKLTSDEHVDGVSQTVIKSIDYDHAARIKDTIEKLKSSPEDYYVTSDFTVIEAKGRAEARQKVDESVTAGFGTVVLGNSKIGAGVTIGSAILNNVHVAADSAIGDSVSLTNVYVQKMMNVGDSVQMSSVDVAGSLEVGNNARVDALRWSGDLHVGEESKVVNVNMDAMGAASAAEFKMTIANEARVIEGSYSLLGRFETEVTDLSAGNKYKVVIEKDGFFKRVWKSFKQNRETTKARNQKIKEIKKQAKEMTKGKKGGRKERKQTEEMLMKMQNIKVSAKDKMMSQMNVWTMIAGAISFFVLLPVALPFIIGLLPAAIAASAVVGLAIKGIIIAGGAKLLGWGMERVYTSVVSLKKYMKGTKAQQTFERELKLKTEFGEEYVGLSDDALKEKLRELLDERGDTSEVEEALKVVNEQKENHLNAIAELRKELVTIQKGRKKKTSRKKAKATDKKILSIQETIQEHENEVARLETEQAALQEKLDDLAQARARNNEKVVSLLDAIAAGQDKPDGRDTGDLWAHRAFALFAWADDDDDDEKRKEAVATAKKALRIGVTWQKDIDRLSEQMAEAFLMRSQKALDTSAADDVGGGMDFLSQMPAEMRQQFAGLQEDVLADKEYKQMLRVLRQGTPTTALVQLRKLISDHRVKAHEKRKLDETIKKKAEKIPKKVGVKDTLTRMGKSVMPAKGKPVYQTIIMIAGTLLLLAPMVFGSAIIPAFLATKILVGTIFGYEFAGIAIFKVAVPVLLGLNQFLPKMVAWFSSVGRSLSRTRSQKKYTKLFETAEKKGSLKERLSFARSYGKLMSAYGDEGEIAAIFEAAVSMVKDTDGLNHDQKQALVTQLFVFAEELMKHGKDDIVLAHYKDLEFLNSSDLLIARLQVTQHRKQVGKEQTSESDEKARKAAQRVLAEEPANIDATGVVADTYSVNNLNLAVLAYRNGFDAAAGDETIMKELRAGLGKTIDRMITQVKEDTGKADTSFDHNIGALQDELLALLRTTNDVGVAAIVLERLFVLNQYVPSREAYVNGFSVFCRQSQMRTKDKVSVFSAVDATIAQYSDIMNALSVQMLEAELTSVMTDAQFSGGDLLKSAMHQSMSVVYDQLQAAEQKASRDLLDLRITQDSKYVGADAESDVNDKVVALYEKRGKLKEARGDYENAYDDYLRASSYKGERVPALRRLKRIIAEEGPRGDMYVDSKEKVREHAAQAAAALNGMSDFNHKSCAQGLVTGSATLLQVVEEGMLDMMDKGRLLDKEWLKKKKIPSEDLPELFMKIEADFLKKAKEFDSSVAADVDKLLARLFYLKGLYYEEMHMKLLAKESYKLALAYDKDLPQAQEVSFRLGKLYLELNSLYNAVHTFDKITDQSQLNDWQKELVRDSYTAYSNKIAGMGATKEALAYLDKGIALLSDDAAESVLERRRELLEAEAKTITERVYRAEKERELLERRRNALSRKERKKTDAPKKVIRKKVKKKGLFSGGSRGEVLEKDYKEYAQVLLDLGKASVKVGESRENVELLFERAMLIDTAKRPHALVALAELCAESDPKKALKYLGKVKDVSAVSETYYGVTIRMYRDMPKTDKNIRHVLDAYEALQKAQGKLSDADSDALSEYLLGVFTDMYGERGKKKKIFDRVQEHLLVLQEGETNLQTKLMLAKKYMAARRLSECVELSEKTIAEIGTAVEGVKEKLSAVLQNVENQQDKLRQVRELKEERERYLALKSEFQELVKSGVKEQLSGDVLPVDERVTLVKKWRAMINESDEEYRVVAGVLIADLNRAVDEAKDKKDWSAAEKALFELQDLFEEIGSDIGVRATIDQLKEVFDKKAEKGAKEAESGWHSRLQRYRTKKYYIPALQRMIDNNEYERALTMADRVLSKVGDHLEVLALRGEAKYGVYDYAGAIVDLETVVKGDAENAMIAAAVTLVQAYLAAGRPAEAVSLINDYGIVGGMRVDAYRARSELGLLQREASDGTRNNAYKEHDSSFVSESKKFRTDGGSVAFMTRAERKALEEKFAFAVDRGDTEVAEECRVLLDQQLALNALVTMKRDAYGRQPDFASLVADLRSTDMSSLVAGLVRLARDALVNNDMTTVQNVTLLISAMNDRFPEAFVEGVPRLDDMYVYEYRLLLAEYYFALGRFVAAEKIMRSLAELFISSEDVALKRMILNKLGSLYERLEQPDEAIQMYKAVLAVDPANEEALNRLAVLYMDTGSYLEATTLLKHMVTEKAKTEIISSLMERITRVMEKNADAMRAKDLLEIGVELVSVAEGDRMFSMLMKLFSGSEKEFLERVLSSDDVTDEVKSQVVRSVITAVHESGKSFGQLRAHVASVIKDKTFGRKTNLSEELHLLNGLLSVAEQNYDAKQVKKELATAIKGMENDAFVSSLVLLGQFMVAVKEGKEKAVLKSFSTIQSKHPSLVQERSEWFLKKLVSLIDVKNRGESAAKYIARIRELPLKEVNDVVLEHVLWLGDFRNKKKDRAGASDAYFFVLEKASADSELYARATNSVYALSGVVDTTIENEKKLRELEKMFQSCPEFANDSAKAAQVKAIYEEALKVNNEKKKSLEKEASAIAADLKKVQAEIKKLMRAVKSESNAKLIKEAQAKEQKLIAKKNKTGRELSSVERHLNVAHKRLGDIYYMQGDLNAALEEYTTAKAAAEMAFFEAEALFDEGKFGERMVPPEKERHGGVSGKEIKKKDVLAMSQRVLSLLGEQDNAVKMRATVESRLHAISKALIREAAGEASVARGRVLRGKARDVLDTITNAYGTSVESYETVDAFYEQVTQMYTEFSEGRGSYTFSSVSERVQNAVSLLKLDGENKVARKTLVEHLEKLSSDLEDLRSSEGIRTEMLPFTMSPKNEFELSNEARNALRAEVVGAVTRRYEQAYTMVIEYLDAQVQLISDKEQFISFLMPLMRKVTFQDRVKLMRSFQQNQTYDTLMTSGQIQKFVSDNKKKPIASTGDFELHDMVDVATVDAVFDLTDNADVKAVKGVVQKFLADNPQISVKQLLQNKNVLMSIEGVDESVASRIVSAAYDFFERGVDNATYVTTSDMTYYKSKAEEVGQAAVAKAHAEEQYQKEVGIFSGSRKETQEIQKLIKEKNKNNPLFTGVTKGYLGERIKSDALRAEIKQAQAEKRTYHVFGNNQAVARAHAGRAPDEGYSLRDDLSGAADFVKASLENNKIFSDSRDAFKRDLANIENVNVVVVDGLSFSGHYSASGENTVYMPFAVFYDMFTLYTSEDATLRQQARDMMALYVRHEYLEAHGKDHTDIAAFEVEQYQQERSNIARTFFLSDAFSRFTSCVRRTDLLTHRANTPLSENAQANNSFELKQWFSAVMSTWDALASDGTFDVADRTTIQEMLSNMAGATVSELQFQEGEQVDVVQLKTQHLNDMDAKATVLVDVALLNAIEDEGVRATNIDALLNLSGAMDVIFIKSDADSVPGGIVAVPVSRISEFAEASPDMQFGIISANYDRDATLATGFDNLHYVPVSETQFTDTEGPTTRLDVIALGFAEMVSSDFININSGNFLDDLRRIGDSAIYTTMTDSLQQASMQDVSKAAA